MSEETKIIPYENSTIPTHPPQVKNTFDYNKLIKADKSRAFYAGQIHSLNKLVTHYHPLMSVELLKCLANELDTLTGGKRKASENIAEIVESAPNGQSKIPNAVANPFYKSPIADLPFMRERIEQGVEFRETETIDEVLDASLGEGK